MEEQGQQILGPGPMMQQQQQQSQQLPPQMFTTAAQLLDLTDSEFLPISCYHITSFSPFVGKKVLSIREIETWKFITELTNRQKNSWSPSETAEN